jgi:DNA-binding NtrC family response regulator
MTTSSLSLPPANTVDPTSTGVASGAPGRDDEYLLCIDGERSFRVRLPASDELVIGRGPHAGMSIDDPLVSRTHARLVRVGDGLLLSDLGSRHGTMINGEPLVESRMLRSGDVIGIGSLLLVVRRSARATHGRDVGEQSMLVRRLAEELARAAQYERELSLIVVRWTDRDNALAVLSAIADRLRVIDSVAPLGTRHAGILLPELGADEAARLAAELGEITAGGSPVARAIGIATAPADGIDADTVLTAARAACDAATPGTPAFARDAVETITAGPQRILVADPGMSRLYELARRLARSSIPILIQGETGAGKELAAATIHAFSARAGGPFVSVNCAAIPETLAESELFGHARGSFSGAHAAKPGYLELASGGTLFLDEVGELAPSVQAKLLRVLETGELMRVGEIVPRRLDLRIVAATNRDLRREIEDGRFRSDLFFRLGAGRLELPPLRDRPRDLGVLASTVLADACRRLERPPLALSIGAAIALYRHDWPGNIRELRHAIEYGAAAAPDGATELERWHLPAGLAAAAREARDTDERNPAPPVLRLEAPAPIPPAATPVPASGFRPIADEVRELERSRMIAALRATAGLQNRAAELIEMPLRTFVTKLRRYAITAADWRS